MKKRATQGKLERALKELESFLDSDDLGSVLDPYEISKLSAAVADVREAESLVYWREQERR